MRASLILIPIIALGSFAYRYINPSGELIVDYDFCLKETPYFSGLSPHGRVLEIETFSEVDSDGKHREKRGSRCLQKMVIDPVYFDVRLPQSYRKVNLEINYSQNEYQDLFQIGVGIDPDNWQWEFGKTTTTLKVIDGLARSPGIDIDLSQAKFDNNRYRFIISAPGLDSSGQEIEFYNMQLKFTKETLTRDNFWRRVKNII